MKYIFLALVVLVSGCSTKASVAGEVVHRVITCTSGESCKTRLAKDCPTGGAIHGIRQAVEIEYSCNS
jgi:hypothetical protein